MCNRVYLLAALAMAGSSTASFAQADEIKLEKIKAADIEQAIARHKGNVVAVDVWADFCAPCKQKFPHLVKLHRDLAKEGLVCISISVDLEENFDGALEFLKKQKANFPNYILWDTDENKDALEKSFAQHSPPIVHIYDRNGKRIKTWEGAIKEDEIDRLIIDLLKQK
jgi:thiol-disulfide isomerase/thioredoxin